MVTLRCKQLKSSRKKKTRVKYMNNATGSIVLKTNVMYSLLFIKLAWPLGFCIENRSLREKYFELTVRIQCT